VIVDALRNLLRLQDERDNSEVARVVNPWIADARAAEKTFVAAHHTRKGGGEHGEGISGGHAFLGLVDIALEVLRDPNQAKNRRLLRSYARVIEGREAVYERGEDGRLTLLGDPGDLQRDEVSRRLLAVATEEFKSTSELRESLGEPKPSLEQVRLALVALAKGGELRRDPSIEEGTAPGRTHRWARFSYTKPGTSNGLSYGLEVRLGDESNPINDHHPSESVAAADSCPPASAASAGRDTRPEMARISASRASQAPSGTKPCPRGHACSKSPAATEECQTQAVVKSVTDGVDSVDLNTNPRRVSYSIFDTLLISDTVDEPRRVSTKTTGTLRENQSSPGCPACGNLAWRQVADGRQCDGPNGCGVTYGAGEKLPV